MEIVEEELKLAHEMLADAALDIECKKIRGQKGRIRITHSQ